MMSTDRNIVMQRAYIELSSEETLRLVRKRKRMNLVVLSLLLLFVGATFALSLIHIAKETEAAASTEIGPVSITQR